MSGSNLHACLGTPAGGVLLCKYNQTDMLKTATTTIASKATLYRDIYFSSEAEISSGENFSGV